MGPAELPAYATAMPDVMIWDDAAFTPMRPGLNTGTALNPRAWGPEVEFAHRWRADHPGQTLYVVKAARGSGSLADDPTQRDWSPDSGELYAVATVAIAQARAALSELADTAIIWHQGEQDAADPAKAAAYGDNLASLRGRMLADWGDPCAKLVIAKISTRLWAANLVRAAQDAQGAYGTDDFPLQADRLHLSGAGQIANGAAAYAAYRAQASSSAQCGPQGPVTGPPASAHVPPHAAGH